MVRAYNAIPGTTWTVYDLVMDAYPDATPWFLASLLPDVVVTGASASFTHTMSLLNTGTAQPSGYTLTDYSGLAAASGARRYPGMTCASADFKWTADGLLETDLKTICMPGSIYPTSAPNETLGALLPAPGYIPTIQIGGGTVASVEDGNIMLARPVTPVHVSDGTPAPGLLFSGPMSVTGAFTFVAGDETELLRYLNYAPASPLSFDINFGSLINANTKIQLHCSKATYKTVVLDRSKDYTQYKVTFESYGNTSDVGASAGFADVKATIQNALPSGTYH